MTGCERHAVQLAIPAFTEFQIVVAVCPADKGDGLQARSESPLSGLWSSRYSRERAGQMIRATERMRVSARSLTRVLRGMTRLAGCRARVIGCGSRAQQKRKQQAQRQKISFPEN